MKRIAFVLFVLFAGFAYARPVVIEPSATLPVPPGGYYAYGGDVAIDGDYALITAFRADPVDPANGDVIAALVYRRTAAGWIYDSTLYETQFDQVNSLYSPSVALRGGVAVLNFGGIFRRTAGGWVREPAVGGFGLGPDIEFSNGRFAIGTGEGDWGANVGERDAAGVWHFTRLQGAQRDGDGDNNGGVLDIDGNTLALAAPDVSEGEVGGPRLFRYHAGSGWSLQTRLADLTSIPLGEQLAVRGNELFVDGGPSAGTNLFRNERPDDEWSPDWQFRGRLQTADSYTSRSVGGALEKSPDFVLQHRFSADLGAYVYHVFRADEEGRYEHAATLTTSTRTALGSSADINGRRIITGSAGYSFATGVYDNAVRIFDLPAEGPFAGTVLMDQFVGNSASSYQYAGGNFALVTAGNQTVFRQQDVSGDARAIHDASQRRDGAIQVEVRPREFNGNDRWFGLITRFTDAQNYYYVTVRSSGRIELKRMAGGVFATLASAPLAVTTQRNYRLRLESVGAYHRVYVDDKLVLSARDTALSQGKLGLMTSRTSADFDNLVITPNNFTTIYSNAFTPGQPAGPWANTGPGAWAPGSSGVYAQSSVAGDARAIIGPASAEDQSVSVRARATAFAVATGQQERWFGALVRYVDDRNYVYVSLRSSNRISLRQLIDGQIHVIAEAPLTVTPGTWYSLRVEALTHATTVYVNGELALEAGNFAATAPRGQVGLLTYKAAAEFDDFLAYQP